ncbi:MAG TPA: hypothetical protein VNF47_04915 [Streptosporangiaceae bacterium]|nr:hypothetical protein [Streptosporangiaceae bacterium]
MTAVSPTRGQVTSYVLDTVRGLVSVPAEDPHVFARVPKSRNDLAAERTRTAGDQDG